jgi:hypothetical protein
MKMITAVVAVFGLSVLLGATEIVRSGGGILPVDWSSADKTYIKKTRSLPTSLQKAVKDVTMPVYIPKAYANEKNLAIVAQPDFYAITIPFKDATMMISGDRTYQQEIISGGEQIKANMKNVANKFIRSEGILSRDFNRHGANYTLSIECNQPKQDSKCTQDSFLKGMYDSLVLVGGKK